MFKNIDPDVLKVYVSPNDPDQKNPTKFYIGPIDPAIRSYIDDQCINISTSNNDRARKSEVKIDETKHKLLLVKFGVRRIDNFCDADGKSIMDIKLDNFSLNRKSYPCLSDDFVNNLGYNTDLVVELVDAVLNYQTLTEQEIKN